MQGHYSPLWSLFDVRFTYSLGHNTLKSILGTERVSSTRGPSAPNHHFLKYNHNHDIFYEILGFCSRLIVPENLGS